jgi:hypothetical protein
VFLLLAVTQIVIVHVSASGFRTAVWVALSPGVWVAYAIAKATGTESIAHSGIGPVVFFVVTAALDIALYGAVTFSIKRLLTGRRFV